MQSLQYQAPTFCAWLSPAGTARDAYEIDRCRWCQKLERAIVKPDVIVALGATAARSVLGRITTIKALRGQPVPVEDGTTAFVTVHPSALLRIEERVDKEQAYRDSVVDLKRAAELDGETTSPGRSLRGKEAVPSLYAGAESNKLG